MDMKLGSGSYDGFRSAASLMPSANPVPRQSKAEPVQSLIVNPAPVPQAPAPSVFDREFSPLLKGLQDWSKGLFTSSNNGKSSAISTAKNEDASTPDYSGKFSLKVKTREGDTVTVHFNEVRVRGAENEQTIEASYEIEGELSDDERKALDQLVEKMVGIADTFFNGVTGFGHLAILDNLDFFDAGQLASFALDVSQERQKMGNGKTDSAYSSLSFDYEVDLDAKKQHLSSELVTGYRQTTGDGQNRYGYDLNSSLDPAAKPALDQTDIRTIGKGLYQSGPTALPAYYQGALQALSRNVDRLSELVDQVAARKTLAEPEQVVTDLFRGIAENHPTYKAAGERAQKSLGNAFDLLPSLIRQSPQLNAAFLKKNVRVTV